MTCGVTGPHRCPQVWTTSTADGRRSNLPRSREHRKWPPTTSSGAGGAWARAGRGAVLVDRSGPRRARLGTRSVGHGGCRIRRRGAGERRFIEPVHDLGVPVAETGSTPVALSGRVVRHRRATNLHQRSLHPASLRRPGRRGGRREAYVSAQQPPPCQEARVPCSDEHPSRSQRAQEPSRQGPRPTLGLIARIRGRHEFARLARDGTRIRCSALWCTWCPDPDSNSTCVAFAISRAYGTAVRRNRLRRRLRAVLAELDRQTPLPPGTMLIGARPQGSSELTFDRVRTELTQLVERIRNAPPYNA